jgi:dihydrofolate reductase
VRRSRRSVEPGGGSAIRQYLAANLLDELQLHIVPILLNGGARLLDDAGSPQLEQVEVIGGQEVTHVTYRVRR